MKSLCLSHTRAYILVFLWRLLRGKSHLKMDFGCLIGSCVYTGNIFFLLPNSLCCICGGYTAISPESLFLITQRLIWFEIHVYSFFYPPNCKMYTLKVFLMGKKNVKVYASGLWWSWTISHIFQFNFNFYTSSL